MKIEQDPGLQLRTSSGWVRVNEPGVGNELRPGRQVIITGGSFEGTEGHLHSIDDSSSMAIVRTGDPEAWRIRDQK